VADYRRGVPYDTLLQKKTVPWGERYAFSYMLKMQKAVDVTV